MGLFKLCESDDPTARELIETAIVNIELHLEECDHGRYLLDSFAVSMLKEALLKV